MKYLYVLGFCVVGAIVYVPCVHYELSLPKLGEHSPTCFLGSINFVSLCL